MDSRLERKVIGMDGMNKYVNQSENEPIETIIRVAQAQDARAILGLLKHVGKDTPYLSVGPKGVNFTVDQQVDLIERYNDSLNNIMLIAESDDQIVGIATVAVIDNDRQSHVAEIGISIIKEYWGYGIGSILTEEIIEFARHAELKVLTLEVVTENRRAVSLYEKYGFNVAGTLSKRLKNDCVYYDTFVMELILT